MTDQAIIEALLAHDEDFTRQFFFRDCKPLFLSIIRRVFPFAVDYDEFVNEFYLYMMERDGYRLRQFEGRSTIYQWLKVIAIRYFVAKRNRMIDLSSDEPLLKCAERMQEADNENRLTARMDVEQLLSRMPNKRYVYVIRRLMLEEAEPREVADELGVNVDNLYNVKKRALAALTQVALKEVESYEKKSK